MNIGFEGSKKSLSLLLRLFCLGVLNLRCPRHQRKSDHQLQPRSSKSRSQCRLSLPSGANATWKLLETLLLLFVLRPRKVSKPTSMLKCLGSKSMFFQCMPPSIGGLEQMPFDHQIRGMRWKAEGASPF